MKRRETLKLFGAAAVAAAIGVAGIPGLFFAQDQKKMVTVVKISGIPWFNALENGVRKADTDFGIDGSVVGPANLDSAQQVKLFEDLIARKVDMIGLVPIDVKVDEPALKRAQEAGISVITHEGPEQKGRTWNVELIDSVVFDEVQMQMQKHLLDKFSSAHDFAEFMQSPAGQKYVMTFSDEVTKPQNTILSSVRLGVVLLFVGPAFCTIPNSSADLQHALWGVGIVITMLGAGFLVSAGVSHLIAKKLKSQQAD